MQSKTTKLQSVSLNFENMFYVCCPCVQSDVLIKSVTGQVTFEHSLSWWFGVLVVIVISKRTWNQYVCLSIWKENMWLSIGKSLVQIPFKSCLYLWKQFTIFVNITNILILLTFLGEKFPVELIKSILLTIMWLQSLCKSHKPLMLTGQMRLVWYFVIRLYNYTNIKIHIHQQLNHQHEWWVSVGSPYFSEPVNW